MLPVSDRPYRSRDIVNKPDLTDMSARTATCCREANVIAWLVQPHHAAVGRQQNTGSWHAEQQPNAKQYSTKSMLQSKSSIHGMHVCYVHAGMQSSAMESLAL